LSINHLEAFDKITEELQTVNPNFKEIRFNYLGSTILMTLREKHLKSTVNCNMLSDGTLRYLCLLAILCNPTPSSLIILDEPEMGLHPDMIFTLSRLIKEKSKTTQIIIATHSPLLLNHFDLENVTFFEKDDKNNSIQKIYNSDGFPENELTGGLWMKGYLGGRRW
jgi:predicted ATPase